MNFDTSIAAAAEFNKLASVLFGRVKEQLDNSHTVHVAGFWASRNLDLHQSFKRTLCMNQALTHRHKSFNVPWCRQAEQRNTVDVGESRIELGTSICPPIQLEHWYMRFSFDPVQLFRPARALTASSVNNGCNHRSPVTRFEFSQTDRLFKCSVSLPLSDLESTNDCANGSQGLYPRRNLARIVRSIVKKYSAANCYRNRCSRYRPTISFHIDPIFCEAS